MAAQITAAIGKKGGDGKSTTIQNLAVQLARRGNRVLVADADPLGTTRKWAQRRREDGTQPLIDVYEVTAKGLLVLLERHAENFDHILIDTVGADSDSMRVALMFADTALCPCPPSHADVEALDPINTLVGQAKVENPRLDAFIFATMVSSHEGAELAQMRKFCKGFEHLVMLDTVIGDRKAFKNALRDGVGATEYIEDDFTRKAINECRALEKEIWGTP